MQAEQRTEPVAHHGEGPAWIVGSGWPDGLYWLDMLAGDVLHVDEQGRVVRRNLGDVVALVRPRSSGGMVYATERGFALDDGPGTPRRRLPDLWEDRSIRMNEGGCDPSGNLYCGSMSYTAAEGGGSLYRLDASGSWSVALTGLTIPNGLEWTSSGEKAFHGNTAAGRIDVFDWDPARGLHNRRLFTSVERGVPDGLTVDADGGVWAAVWGGHAVHGYDPDGTLTEVVNLPVAQVTACTFGGDDLGDLLITTSREGLSDPERAAGAVFVARPGAHGQPCRSYGG